MYLEGGLCLETEGGQGGFLRKVAGEEWRHKDPRALEEARRFSAWVGHCAPGVPGASRPLSCLTAPPGAAPAQGTGTGGAAGGPGTTAVAAAAAAGPSARPEVAA